MTTTHASLLPYTLATFQSPEFVVVEKIPGKHRVLFNKMVGAGTNDNRRNTSSRSAMRSLKVVGLLFASVCIHLSSGFVG